MAKPIFLDLPIIADFFGEPGYVNPDEKYYHVCDDPAKLTCGGLKEFPEELTILLAPNGKNFCDRLNIADVKVMGATEFVSADPVLNSVVEKMCGMSTRIFCNKKEYTGINCGGINSFYFENNIPYFLNANHESKRVTANTKGPWGVRCDSIYQEMLTRLLGDPNIPLVSCLSSAGHGKTYLALANAMDMVFNQKRYDNIVIIKSTHEVGLPLGYLPGNVDEKIESHFDYAKDLIDKLLFLAPPKFRNFDMDIFNNIKFKPINYLRGATIDNAYVIIDEAQNLKEYEIRTVLSRMGRNVKAVILGDNNQIDNIHVDASSNGLSAVIRKMKGQKEYAHITLKGKCSRGPICDLVERTGL